MKTARWYLGLVCFVSYCFCIASLLLWGQGWDEGKGRLMKVGLGLLGEFYGG